jgi:hypothetical protein
MRHHPFRARAVVTLAAVGILVAAVVVSDGGLQVARESQRGLRPAASGPGELDRGGEEKAGEEESKEILGIAREAAVARVAPAAFGQVDLATARVEAAAAADALPVVGGSWTEVTTQPYFNDDPGYRDPFISNSGAGWGYVTGRFSTIAVDGDRVYGGAADGGLWRSTDGGDTWTPLTDNFVSTSSGAVAVDPSDHSVWYGTGEFSTAFENYLGTGIYVSYDFGDTWSLAGGDELNNHLVNQISFDGQGYVFAATSNGVVRRATSDPPGTPWEAVLQPGTAGPYGFWYANDVQVQPGTDGRVVIANVAWRNGGTDYDGMYVSRDGGDAGTWEYVHMRGLNSNDVLKSSLGYSSDGSRLYAVIEGEKAFNTSPETALKGVYLSRSGNIQGPWKLIATSKKLGNSPGSALGYGFGYSPGIQAWYNQFVGVDPDDPLHVYVGLEEVYETTDGGHSWTTIGAYWNFGLACFVQGGPDNCPMTTHPDQHGVAFGQGRVWIGNDGGVYSRDVDGAEWNNHNLNLRTLQYYYGGVGEAEGGGLAYWGGLQDNGVSLLLPGAATMVSPFGGDGGDVIVDPGNADRTVQEYVTLDMWLTTVGGRSDGSTNAWREITPSCFAFTYLADPCDPNPRFIAPFRADVNDANGRWVAGGQMVWVSESAWDTECSASACDWALVHDTGPGNQVTALAMNGEAIYAGWCGGGCNPGPAFSAGVDTNFGGEWHTVAGPAIANDLPQRYVFNLVVDPANPGHVYAMYSGYSRRWIPGGGVGHVFESTDGGETWTDISGNLPDAPADDLVISGGSLVLATDVGVFISDATAPSVWSRFGSGLPGAVPNDLTTTPDGSSIVAVTHGRGMWSIAAP